MFFSTNKGKALLFVMLVLSASVWAGDIDLQRLDGLDAHPGFCNESTADKDTDSTDVDGSLFSQTKSESILEQPLLENGVPSKNGSTLTEANVPATTTIDGKKKGSLLKYFIVGGVVSFLGFCGVIGSCLYFRNKKGSTNEGPDWIPNPINHNPNNSEIPNPSPDVDINKFGQSTNPVPQPVIPLPKNVSATEFKEKYFKSLAENDQTSFSVTKAADDSWLVLNSIIEKIVTANDNPSVSKYMEEQFNVSNDKDSKKLLKKIRALLSIKYKEYLERAKIIAILYREFVKMFAKEPSTKEIAKERFAIALKCCAEVDSDLFTELEELFLL